MAIEAYGPTGTLREIELPVPSPGPGQVRVRVHASAVNPADFKVVTGKVKLLHDRRFPLVAGYDLSGVVDEVGEGVNDLVVGDEVFGHHHYSGKTGLGAFAEHTLIGAGMVARKPPGVDHRAAAAAATSGLTALQSFRDKARLSSDGRVLVIGASGSVGSLAVGVAKRLGASVTGVCSGYAVDLVRELGADRVIDRKKEDFLAGDGGFDAILDASTMYSFGACKRLLANGGTFVALLPSFALLTGLVSSVFSSKRCTWAIVNPVREDLERIGKWLGDGMGVPIHETLPIREVAKAIDTLMAGGVLGKIAIDVYDGF
jgi:NADPH:quinone reductase-like Zn-dependent oxidoreductase